MNVTNGGGGLASAAGGATSFMGGTVVALSQQPAHDRQIEPGYHDLHRPVGIIYIPSSQPAAHQHPAPEYLPLNLGAEIVFVACASLAVFAALRVHVRATFRRVLFGHLGARPRVP